MSIFARELGEVVAAAAREQILAEIRKQGLPTPTAEELEGMVREVEEMVSKVLSKWETLLERKTR